MRRKERQRQRETLCVQPDDLEVGCLIWYHALYPLGPVATLRFCHLRPRCVSKQRRTTNVIITDRVWWIWCDAGLAVVATRPQRSPHSVASNSRPDYFDATRSRSLFLTKNECCVSAAAAAIWEIQWRRTYAAAGPSGYRGWSAMLIPHANHYKRSWHQNSQNQGQENWGYRDVVGGCNLTENRALTGCWQNDRPIYFIKGGSTGPCCLSTIYILFTTNVNWNNNRKTLGEKNTRETPPTRY